MRAGPSRDRAAFTLIEVLLALAVTLLVVLLVVGIFRTVVDVTSGQRQRQQTDYAAGEAVDRLSADLGSLFSLPGDDACAITLRKGGADAESSEELSFCTLQTPPAGEDLRWASVSRVAWRVVAAGGTSMLVRVAAPHRTPGATNEAILVAALERFRVQLHDGAAWQDTWPPKDDAPPPRGARLEIAPREGPAVRAEVWIPAGTVFTTRLERAAAAM
jgi:type II secretory pathway pseudopilin PulG